MRGSRIVPVGALVFGLVLGGCLKSPEGEVAKAPEAAPVTAKPAPMAPGPADDAKLAAFAGKKDEKAKDKGGGGGDEPAETWKRSVARANTSRLMIGDDEHLPLTGMQVQARVDGFRARVLIDFYFFNDRDRQLEGNFQLRLPESGSPWFMAFGQSTWTADGQPVRDPRYAGLEVVRKRGLEPARIVEDRRQAWAEPKVARMVPKEQAARAYGDTVRRNVDPALMEWAGAGVFRARVFPLAPGRLHRVVVGYDVDLEPVGKGWELALPLPAEVPSAMVDLDVAAPKGLEVSVVPAAKPARADGRLRYRFDSPEGGRVTVRLSGATDLTVVGQEPDTGAYLAASLEPKLPKGKAVGGEAQAIFLVDVSMSANPDRFGIWLKLLRAILDANRSRLKRFAVMFFNLETHWYKAGWVANTPAEVQALMSACDELLLEGATDLGAALREAVAPAWLAGRPPATDFFLLSDGAVTWGQGDAFALAKRLEGAGALFAYRTGLAGGDDRMLTHLARASGGAVFAVTSEDAVAAAATAHTARPWEVTKVSLAGVSDLLVAGRPRFLFPGQRLVLAGRGVPAKGAALQLALAQGDRQRTVEVALGRPIPSELAPRIYGQLAVAQLEDFVEATGEKAGAYARHFRVAGKTTSLLMLESEADYQRYGIVPKDDSKTVRDNQARDLLAAALDALWELLGDAKNAFFGRLKKLAADPQIQLQVPPALRKALEALPSETFRVEAPPLVCKQHTTQGVPEALLGQLARQKPEYDTVVTEAKRRAGSLGPADGLKALSSLVEANPGDGVLARDVGFAALEWGLAAQAYHLFKRVADARPFEPQTYRALALSQAEQGAPELALAWFEVGLAGQWDARFGEFTRILMLDYLRFLRRLGPEGFAQPLRAWVTERTGQLAGRLGIERADLLVSITWNTDRTDVDLHVIEPSGEECYYEHTETKSGGRLTDDVTQGYGPEMYLLPKAPPGTYKVRVKYFASDASRTSVRTKVYATVIRNWGAKDERVTRKVVTLQTGKEMHDIATVKVP